MQKKNPHSNIFPILSLTVLCVVSALILSFVNRVTEPVIAKSQLGTDDMARNELLPDSDSFTQVEIDGVDGLIGAYRADNGAGWVFTVQTGGFGGRITVLTAIRDGRITGVRMTEHTETAGYGSRAADDNYDYTSQYEGVGAELEGVKTISGSTVTSKAFEKAVKTAFDAYGRVNEKD